MLAKSDFELNKAIRFFNSYAINASFIVPTEVGLGKSIMDATSQLRIFLKENNIHDYEGQAQGSEGKVIKDSYFVEELQLTTSKTSFYRPVTKGRGGDPRIWFSGLSKYAKAYNLLGVVCFDNAIYLINLSDYDVIKSIDNPNSPLSILFAKINSNQSAISEELLDKLKIISQEGWIKTVTQGDTGVGATLEHCLGIEKNSSKQPDYNGIELKAKRQGSKLKTATRSNLFAQVPDWKISFLKSSAQILDTYGYYRDDAYRLNCSVSSIKPNSQGLQLIVDENDDLLHEIYQENNQKKDVVSWRFETLRKRLLSKHNETFWVGAACTKIKGVEYFHYTDVIHTKKPSASIFHSLLSQGIITLDHLIKKQNGAVREKGPLFKIKPSDLELLFPSPSSYILTST